MNKKNTYYLMDNFIFDTLGRVVINDKLFDQVTAAAMDDFVPTSFVDVHCDSGCGQNPYCGNNITCNATCK